MFFSNQIQSASNTFLFFVFLLVPGAPFHILADEALWLLNTALKRPEYSILQKRRETIFRHLIDQHLTKKKKKEIYYDLKKAIFRHA